MRMLIIGLLLLAVMINGCVTQEVEQVPEEVQEPPPAPAPPAPVFSISSPGEGESVLISGDTGDVTMTFSTQNLILKPAGGSAKAGEGHFSISVNGEKAGTAASKIHVLEGLAPGDYIIYVELLNNDGSKYSPTVTDSVSFSVETAEPEEYQPQPYTVKIKDFSYEPASITVKETDTITFVNEGAYPRSATCFIKGEEVFDTDVLAPGKSATVTLDRVMECVYHSTTHYAMSGTVIVESNE